MKKLLGYVNKEITDFSCNVVLLGDSLRDVTVDITPMHENTQATLEWIDEVRQRLSSVHSDLHKEIERKVD